MRYTRLMNREISQRDLRNDSAEELRAVSKPTAKDRIYVKRKP